MNRIVRLSAIALAMSSVSSLALGAPFTPGNLAVARVGTGSGALSAVASAVFIDEYTTSGTLVQSIPLPTADSGANQTLTVAGSSTSEAMLTLSTDARYLVMTGYDAAPGTGAVAGTTSAATNRIVGRIDATGAVDTSTGFTSAFNTSNIRAAASVDGSGIWTGGTGAGGTGGIWYQTFGTIGAGTQVSTTVTNTRNLGIFASQLYTTASSGAIRLASVGLGLPTTTGQLMSNLSGLPTASGSPYGFVVLDRSPSVAGVDTIYYADDATGLQKYSTGDGLNWTARGSVAGNMRGLTARIDSGTGNVILFGTSTTTSANALVTLTDTAAFDATISATPSNIATAATNTVFRGVAFVPSAAATPELSIAGANVAEGNTGCGGGTTPLNFTVTATVAPLSALTFNFATSDGSATAGSDYTGVMAGTGTINAGQTTGTATVQVSCDNRVEANETFTASLTAGVGYTISATNGSATGTISNDEVVAARISDVTQAEGTGGGTTAFNFTVSLDNGVEAGLGGISMLYTVDAAGATPGTDGVDFLSPAPEPGLFTIPDGSNSATLTVQVGADSTDEPNETFAVTLSNIVTGSIVDATGDGTITNDDSVIPVISISNVSVTEGDAGGPAVNAVFTVSIVPAPTGTVTVNADTANDSALSTSDYTSTSATLNFDNANTTRQFTVPITNDCTIESSEQFFVNLSGLTGTATIGDNQGVGTITDNDVAITASIAFLTPSANEGDTSTNTRVARVSLSQAMQCGDFTYSVSNTGGTATAGNDYQAVSVSNQTISGATTTADINVTINGDRQLESDEDIVLTLTGTGTNVAIAQGTAAATLVNDDIDFTLISAIQGSGLRSPFAGSANTPSASDFRVGGIVTAIDLTPNGTSENIGFFMQAVPESDSDPLTSEGIFVYTTTAPSVSVGDRVDVRGKVYEYFNQTRINPALSTSGYVAIDTGGNALPAAIVFDSSLSVPVPGITDSTLSCGATNFECFESMRVAVPNGTVMDGNQRRTGDSYAQVFFTPSLNLGVREAGIRYGVAPGTGNAGAGVWDGNPETLEMDADRLGAVPTNTELVIGAEFSASSGVLSYSFGDYEFWPTQLTINQSTNVLPRPVSPRAANSEIRIGSFNVLRLCDTQGDTSCVSPVPNQTALDLKLQKLATYIVNVLRSPDLVGLQEVENLDLLDSQTVGVNDLVAAISNLGGPSYRAFLSEGNDPGGIDVGFLVRNDTVSVTSVEQLGLTEQWFDPDALPNETDELHDRPPLLLRGIYIGGSNGRFPFAVMNNHTRSRGCVDFVTGGSGCTTQANSERVRSKRFTQGVSIAGYAQSFQTANPEIPLVMVGDYNAYQFADGFADVVGLISGTFDNAKNACNATLSNAQIEDCKLPVDGLGNTQNVVVPPMTNLVTTMNLEDQYSYQFTEDFGVIQGYTTAGAEDARNIPTLQVLDNAMATAAAAQYVVDFDYGRANVPASTNGYANATGPDGLGGTQTSLAIGSSDHDGFVLTLDSNCSGIATLDPDTDGACSIADNCPAVSNADQIDTDGDGLGNLCDPFPNDADTMFRNGFE